MSSKHRTPLYLLEATQHWSADNASKALDMLDEITTLIWELHGQRINRQCREDAQGYQQDPNQHVLDLDDADSPPF